MYVCVDEHVNERERESLHLEPCAPAASSLLPYFVGSKPRLV